MSITNKNDYKAIIKRNNSTLPSRKLGKAFDRQFTKEKIEMANGYVMRFVPLVIRVIQIKSSLRVETFIDTA